MGEEKPAVDQVDGHHDQEKQEQQSAPNSDGTNDDKKKDGQAEKKPAGGFDATPVPHAPPGYTVKITIHRATNLPMADLGTFSSDPYVLAELQTDLPSRHKADPGLEFRTRTIWKTTEPEWNEEWILGHVPASGLKLKARIYDEDSNDHDDRLGNVQISTGRISENWQGIKDKAYKIKKKTGSKRAYGLRALAVCMRKAESMSGDLYISIEVLGKTEGNEGGRCYTMGLNYWFKHKSPLLGRIANKREDDQDSDSEEESGQKREETGNGQYNQSNEQNQEGPGEMHSISGKSRNQAGKKKPGKYAFQANQMQLRGPTPPELYHRFVEFRPIIGSLFNAKGLRGLILHRALHYQHGRVYNFNRETTYGVFREPGDAMTRQFLDLVHHDKGGRIFTYVLTLDAMLRFTETGKEFGIDLLSKHTMHSDASIYIAFSGEFFIRRLKHAHRESPEEAEAKTAHKGKETSKSPAEAAGENNNETHPPKHISSGPPSGPPPRDPHYFELIIDNDSGTYRPNAKTLPILRKFLESNLPGLKIVTLDCNGDKDRMNKWKDEQRAKKKEEGSGIVFTQINNDSSSSLSSEDVERAQQRADAGDDESSGGARHRLGEAAGPFLGNHAGLRKIVGAEGS